MNLDYQDQVAQSGGDQNFLEFYNQKAAEMMKVRVEDAVALVNTQLQQIFFLVYQVLRGHTETAAYTSALGQNSELQQRWLVATTKRVAESNSYIETLDAKIQ